MKRVYEGRSNVRPVIYPPKEARPPAWPYLSPMQRAIVTIEYRLAQPETPETESGDQAEHNQAGHNKVAD